MLTDGSVYFSEFKPDTTELANWLADQPLDPHGAPLGSNDPHLGPNRPSDRNNSQISSLYYIKIFKNIVEKQYS